MRSALSALGWLGCSDFASEHDRLPAPESTTLVADAWDCATSAAVSDPLVYSEANSLALSLELIDVVTRSTPQNLEVRACLITDPTCLRPLTARLSPDAEGIVNVPLAIGLSGFLEITGDGMAPSLFVLPGPLSVDLAALLASRPVFLVSDGSTPGAQLLVDMTPDTGTLVVTVFDCSGRGAAGVRLEADAAAAVPFAIIDGLPVQNQRTTTSYAIVGFANVAPGVAIVSGYRVDTGQLVGRAAVPVRSGWDTLVNMLPQPGLRP